MKKRDALRTKLRRVLQEVRRQVADAARRQPQHQQDYLDDHDDDVDGVGAAADPAAASVGHRRRRVVGEQKVESV